jgi:hypothetical protein
MPKPENFDKLTPDQKRQARLDAWINHEGLEFTSPEAEKGYRERAQMFADVFLLKKSKRVPVAISTGFVPFLYAGYSCKDAMYDTKKLGAAMKKFHVDFMPDLLPRTVCAGQASRNLDYKLYHWPGHGVPEAPAVHGSGIHEGEQYEPTCAIMITIRTTSPLGALEPWKELHLPKPLELPFIPWGMLPFGLPHIQETFKS